MSCEMAINGNLSTLTTLASAIHTSYSHSAVPERRPPLGQRPSLQVDSIAEDVAPAPDPLYKKLFDTTYGVFLTLSGLQNSVTLYIRHLLLPSIVAGSGSRGHSSGSARERRERRARSSSCSARFSPSAPAEHPLPWEPRACRTRSGSVRLKG